MQTMSHTPKQRKLWHAGKRNAVHGNASAVHAMMKGNFNGAYTPSRIKRGIYYKPLKKGERP